MRMTGVRVLQVVSKPGDVAKMHHHPDHVVYAVKGGKAALTSGGKTQEMELKIGSAIFLEAQTLLPIHASFSETSNCAGKQHGHR